MGLYRSRLGAFVSGTLVFGDPCVEYYRGAVGFGPQGLVQKAGEASLRPGLPYKVTGDVKVRL